MGAAASQLPRRRGWALRNPGHSASGRRFGVTTPNVRLNINCTDKPPRRRHQSPGQPGAAEEPQSRHADASGGYPIAHARTRYVPNKTPVRKRPQSLSLVISTAIDL